MYAQGRKNHVINAAGGSIITLNYGFLNLFWVFNFTYGYRYSVVTPATDGSTNYRQITKEEAATANGGKPVMPPVFERYSFVIFLVILAGVFVWNALTQLRLQLC